MSRIRVLVALLAVGVLLVGGVLWQLGGEGAAPPPAQEPMLPGVAADAAREADAKAAEESPSRARSAHATVAIPHRYRFQGVSSVPRARSYHELLNAYSPDERAIYDGYIARVYPGAMSFYGEAQLEWLAENGFPMPDDVLVASAMSEEALLDLSTQGSPKATFFYVDRVMERLRLEGNIPWDGYSSEDVDQRVALGAFLERRLLANGSPFAGLVYAQASTRKPDPMHRDTDFVVGHAWARVRGWTADLGIDPSPVHRAEQNVLPSVAIMHFHLLESMATGHSPQFRHLTVTRMPPADFALYEQDQRRLSEEQLERFRAGYVQR